MPVGIWILPPLGISRLGQAIKKECEARPMSKGKVQLTSRSCSSDLTLGP